MTSVFPNSEASLFILNLVSTRHLVEFEVYLNKNLNCFFISNKILSGCFSTSFNDLSFLKFCVLVRGGGGFKKSARSRGRAFNLAIELGA